MIEIHIFNVYKVTFHYMTLNASIIKYIIAHINKCT